MLQLPRQIKPSTGRFALATEASNFLHSIPAGVVPCFSPSERRVVAKDSPIHPRAELPSGMIATGPVVLCLNQPGSASSISATSEVTPSGFGNRPLSGDSDICQRTAVIGTPRLTISRSASTFSGDWAGAIASADEPNEADNAADDDRSACTNRNKCELRIRRSLLRTWGVCRGNID